MHMPRIAPEQMSIEELREMIMTVAAEIARRDRLQRCNELMAQRIERLATLKNDLQPTQNNGPWT